MEGSPPSAHPGQARRNYAKLAWSLASALLTLAGLGTGYASAEVGQPDPAAAGSPAGVFNVRAFGAAGNGTVNDAPAVNDAIAAANGAGGGVVEFPPGTYLAGSSIHMMSNVTLQLDADSTIMGAASGYDPPEPNSYSQYQDYGHSHFHDAMIWGENLINIGLTGSGTIDGGGHLVTGTPQPGQADKAISLVRCDNLTVSGITVKDAGHFAMLIDDCTHVVSDHLTILNNQSTVTHDGWNLVDTRDVKITNITIASNDDALAFKGDWALGQSFNSGDVTVSNAHLSSIGSSALVFGSETCGNFTNYHFSGIYITGAGKSGLGMELEDDAHISGVYYHHVVISGTGVPIMDKIGTRLRCGGNPTTGSISNVHYDDVTATHAVNQFGQTYTPTLWGQPGHPISDVTFSQVHVTMPGGNAAMDPNAVPADDEGSYYPSSLGTRPAYGFYLHNVSGITFSDSSVGFESNDQRSALIANAGSGISLHDFTAQAGSASPFDVGFQAVSGYCFTNSASTDGAQLRVSTPGSTPACQAGLDNFSLSVTPSSQSAAAGSAATYQVATTVVSGSPGPVTLTAGDVPRGVSVSFSPATVTPGQTSQMTVSASADSLNGTHTIAVTGTGATATQYATVTVAVTGGLQISNLSVADTANAAGWSVQSDLQPGDPLYGDRTFTLSTVPAALQGADWIRTANGSKLAPENPLVTFGLSAPATVAVAVDTRLGGRLPWMDTSWADTGMQLTDNESHPVTFEVYQKNFPAGQVSLGPQDLTDTSSMYTIIVY